jgi:hypothetical protein
MRWTRFDIASLLLRWRRIDALSDDVIASVGIRRVRQDDRISVMPIQ